MSSFVDDPMELWGLWGLLAAFWWLSVWWRFSKRPARPSEASDQLHCAGEPGSLASLRSLPPLASVPSVTYLTTRESRSDVMEQELKHEWDIVAKSIDAAELASLEVLYRLLEDCEGHPACWPEPHHRRALTLLRFLRARSGNVEKAASMLRASLNWRHEYQIDQRVALWRREFLEQATARARAMKLFGVDHFCGVDTHGSPVVVLRPSVWDPKGMEREAGLYSMQMQTVASIEHELDVVRESTLRSETLVPATSVFYDFGNYGVHGPLNWHRRVMQGLRLSVTHLGPIVDNNYPETLGVLYACRVGKVVEVLSRSVWPFIPEGTRNKIRVLSLDSEPQLRAALQVTMAASMPGFLRAGSDLAKAALSVPSGGLVPEGFALSQKNLAHSKEVQSDASMKNVPAPTSKEDLQNGTTSCFCGLFARRVGPRTRKHDAGIQIA